MSTNQQAPYFSPSVENHCVPVSDLYMMRFVAKKKDFGLIRNAWLGTFFTA